MKEVFQKESPYRKLVYTKSFKEIVVKHPRLLSMFQGLEKRIRNKAQMGEATVGSFIEEKGMKITVIDKQQLVNKRPLGSYFKVEISEGAFFVKTVPGLFDTGTGTQELESLEKVKKLLVGLKNVEVVDFQLGYQDNNGTTYFVSKWEDGVVLRDYLPELEIKIGRIGNEKIKHDLVIEKEELWARYFEINSLLHDIFFDVTEGNILYNPMTKKLTVFDIYKK